MKPLSRRGLYAITDCLNLTTEQLVSKTEQILQAGAVMLQYRNKNDDYSSKLALAGELQKLCMRYDVPFIINDDPGLARVVHADGVHLGKEDAACRTSRIMLGPDSIIGISCYNDLGRAHAAEDSGASYIAFGAFFPTQTRKNTVKAGPELIHEAKQRLQLPVVAIGGITPDNGKILIDAGADFIAVCSGLYAAADASAAARAYTGLFKPHN